MPGRRAGPIQEAGWVPADGLRGQVTEEEQEPASQVTAAMAKPPPYASKTTLERC